jgi:hypothetical protein
MTQRNKEETIDEARKGAKSFAGYSGRCKTCGASLKDRKADAGSTQEADPAVHIMRAFVSMGLSEAEAIVAARLDEPILGDVKVRDLLNE